MGAWSKRRRGNRVVVKPAGRREIGRADDVHFGEAHLAGCSSIVSLPCVTRTVPRVADIRTRSSQPSLRRSRVRRNGPSRRLGSRSRPYAAARIRCGNRCGRRRSVRRRAGKSRGKCPRASLIGPPFRQPVMENRKPVGHLCLGHDRAPKALSIETRRRTIAFFPACACRSCPYAWRDGPRTPAESLIPLRRLTGKLFTRCNPMMRSAKAGNKTAQQFRDAALPWLDDAYAFAQVLMRTEADAEQAVQDCYLRAQRQFDGFRGGSRDQAVAARDPQNRLPGEAVPPRLGLGCRREQDAGAARLPDHPATRRRTARAARRGHRTARISRSHLQGDRRGHRRSRHHRDVAHRGGPRPAARGAAGSASAPGTSRCEARGRHDKTYDLPRERLLNRRGLVTPFAINS